MSTVYASIADITTLYRALTPAETEKAEALLPVVSSRLRVLAGNVGKNLDWMIAENPDLAEVAKSVTVDVVARNLMTPTDSAPMSQFSESGLGYTVSGTYLVPGGGIFIKDTELRALGLKNQRYGVIDFYGTDEVNGHGCY
ncbi:MAG: phage Gp19/Gp15/Gp42 family protein [Oscillospiraceae bacterium]|nr:phage Gp19/Gp15/Gp42 family protein [Oscillospiraceae bacterium]